MKKEVINEVEKKKKKRRRFVILFFILLVLLLLGLFGCKACKDNKNSYLVNSIPKLNNEGYWTNNKNEKLTDHKNEKNLVNSYEYYKNIDPSYKDKSLEEFVNDYQSNNLAKVFKVEFIDLGKNYDSREYKFLNRLVFPLDPKREGYNFKGWKLLDDNASKDIIFTNKNNLLVDADFKFESVYENAINPNIKDYYKVEFIVDNKTYKEFEVKKNSKIDSFDAPSKSNYLFLGWYDQYDNKFEFSTGINQDLTIKAKYFSLNSYNNSIKKHEVNYLDEDGNIYQTIEVENFGKAVNIPGKTKVGYHFVRWLEEDSLLPFDFDTQIVKPTNLKPEYEINKYTVQFAGAGINNLPDSFIDVPHGTTLVEPDVSAMSKVGYHFMNKYLDQHGNEFVFGTTQVTENLVLTPVFKINKYTITFKANPDFDNIPDEITGVEHGSKVSKPAGYNLQCNVDGYELDGLYYTDSNGVEQEFKFNDTVVESDIEITIKKKIKRHRVTIEDHLGNQVSSAEYDHFTELTLPKFTTDYVYEYFYNGANSSEHYNEDKDANNFKYEVTKNITLKPKAHKKHIKFSLTDNDINVLQGGTLIPTKTIYVVTGKPITLPTAKKDNYYRLKPIVWQYKDNGGVYHDYSEATYSSNFDTTLYLKNEADVFDDVFLFEEHTGYIEITGLNNKYKNIEDFNLNIPSSINDVNVTRIKGLNNLTKIKDVTLPDTVTMIKADCFDGSSLQTINLDTSKVETIEVRAFHNCAKLKSIKLPAECTSIGEQAFRSCVEVTSIDLSLSQLETIPTHAFNNCKKVTEIKLPNTLKKIDNQAFRNSASLLNLDISNTQVEEIGEYGFSLCANLKTLKLPTTIKKIKLESFYNCPNLEELNIETTNVEEIGNRVFMNCAKLQSIKLPATCKQLGDEAFRGCVNATSIDLSLTQLETIPGHCFHNCKKASEIKLPNTLKYIKDFAFNNSVELLNLDLSSSQVEEIGEKAFEYCPKIQTISLPNTVKTIKNRAFANCGALTALNLNTTNIEEIGEEAFINCNNLTEIKLPATFNKIGKGAFGNCKSVTTIDLSLTTLTEIPENCFTTCLELTTLKLPGTIETLKNKAFDNLVKLTRIDFDGTVADFNRIIKHPDWYYHAPLDPVVYCTDGTINL
ncbi:MAG: leucine-rich repeat protein [Candidatus Onthovivens sp.]